MHLLLPDARQSVSSWLAVLACCLIAAPAHADVTATDMQVAARALSFVSNPLSGTVRVGIVYTPGSSKSRRQAESLRTMLAKGLRIGALELRPVLVKSGEKSTADVDLFFLTEYMETNDAANLPGDGTLRQILCITTDIEQVRSGNCVLGVRSRPKVEVFVNRAAAEADGITFSTVFRVMITEL
jgi:hypothetical protein